MPLETDLMADELKDHRIPVMMSASEVAAIDGWRRSQPDLPSRSEAIRRLCDFAVNPQYVNLQGKLAAVDGWIEKQNQPLTRQEAICKLVEIGLKANA